MLTILSDPTGATGRKSYEWDFSKTLHENISAHLHHGADCELLINGERVNPLTDKRMDAAPSFLDSVVVIRRPAGFDPLTWAIIIVVAALAVTYSMMPKLDTSAGAVGKDSPNNRLTAQSNVARTYQAIPDVYGERRVWPDMIQPSSVEYINNVKYVTEWLCISRGAGDVSSVQYANTPIINGGDSSYEIFQPVGPDPYPENNPTTITNVFETFASDDVNGQEIIYPTPYPQFNSVGDFEAVAAEELFSVVLQDGPALGFLKGLAGSGSAVLAFDYIDTFMASSTFNQTCQVISFSTLGTDVTFIFSSEPWADDSTGTGITFSITPIGINPNATGPYNLPLECDRIRWNTVFLRGLKGYITIRAEWWKVDGLGVEIPFTREAQDNSYTADTFDQLYFTNNVTPVSGLGRYRFQVSRLTPQVGTEGTDVAKLEEVYAVRYYAEKIIPGVSIIRLTTKATEQATGYSERKFNLRFARKIRTLTSDTLSTSKNFGRIMAHIWTLTGNDISELDTATIAGINAEFGEASPLLEFNASLDDSDMSLGERLQLVANHARCLVWRNGTQWTVTRDQAQQYPRMQFDYRNLASDGESAIGFASHLPASADGVEIEYVDPETQSKKTHYRLNIVSGAPVVGESTNPKKIALPGCTNATQAQNRGQLEARRLLYQRQSVSDKALSDANALGLGALVRWIDPNDFYGDDDLQGGEVVGINGATLLTSEALQWGVETNGRIAFTDTQGGRLGATIACTKTEGGVVLASVPGGLFLADGVNRQCGSRYAFAVGLTEAEMESAGLYTVTELKPSNNGTVSISLAQYDSRIYESD